MARDNIIYQRLGGSNTTYQRYKIPQILQPRLTWRYVLCSAAACYVAYCFVFSMPLFAHNLPRYTGHYPVGAIDIEAPLQRPRTINDATFRGSKQKAFEVETVLFTLYYPAADVASPKPKHYWIPKPLAATAEGYAKFAHINNFFTNNILTASIGLLVGGIKIPAKVDVPLAEVTPSAAAAASARRSIIDTKLSDSTETLVGSIGDKSGGFPIIVFTHGMASSRTDYTHYCGELASRGYVVAAIEHRDGSGPGTIIMKQGQADRKLIHFGLGDIENNDQFDTATFKEAQLQFRQAEIEETVRVVQAINDGHGSTIQTSNPRAEGKDLSHWANRLDISDGLIIAGHSYGATGALQALKPSSPSSSLSSTTNTAASSNSDDKLPPFKGGIILDPGKSSGPLNSDLSSPIIVIHSNSWSKTRSIFSDGRPHFDVVRDLVLLNNSPPQNHASWFMTSLGTSHPSVTDAPLIEPLLLSWTTGAQIDVHEGLKQYVHVSDDFMHFVMTGNKRGLLKEKAQFSEYDEKSGWGKYKGQGKGEDWRRFWQVHIAPPASSSSST